jgi:activator of HSP90 ATPase
MTTRQVDRNRTVTVLTLSQWQNGRRRDGWGRYTRRRKWCRDAQLVEVLQHESHLLNKPHDENVMKTPTRKSIDDAPGDGVSVSTLKDDDESVGSTRKRRTWFSRRSSNPNSEKSAALSSASVRSTAAMEDDEEDIHIPLSVKQADRSAAWGMADDPDMLFG